VVVSNSQRGRHQAKLRIVTHVRTGFRRWVGTAIGGYHDGENTLVDDPI
jgi:hypothetical protein